MYRQFNIPIFFISAFYFVGNSKIPKNQKIRNQTSSRKSEVIVKYFPLILEIVVQLETYKSTDVNQVKKKRNDGIIDTIMNKRFFQQRQKNKLTPVHDVSSHVKSHSQDCKSYSDQKETQPRHLIEIFWIQKQERYAKIDRKLLVYNPDQKSPNQDQSQVFAQVQKE